MELFFGTPAHPFFVHAPIVLLPIAGIVTLVLALRADWRDRLGWWLTAGLASIVAMLWLARESGYELRKAGAVNGDVDQHQTLANQTFVIAIIWLVVFAGLAFRDREVRTIARPQPLSADVVQIRRDPAALGLTILASVVAIVATIWLIRTGHAGAESHWSPTVRLFDEG